MASQEEARLVARILAGETRAVDDFISSYRPFIYAVLTRHMKLLPQDADEVFQQFLIHIWEDDFRRLRDWTGSSALRAYLGKIARNLARDHRRKEAKLRSAEPVDREVLDYGIEDIERSAAIERAFVELSGRDRDLIYRRYYLDQSYREIAEALHMTINNIGVALLRAERRLKRIILTGM